MADSATLTSLSLVRVTNSPSPATAAGQAAASSPAAAAASERPGDRIHENAIDTGRTTNALFNEDAGLPARGEPRVRDPGLPPYSESRNRESGPSAAGATESRSREPSRQHHRLSLVVSSTGSGSVISSDQLRSQTFTR